MARRQVLLCLAVACGSSSPPVAAPDLNPLGSTADILPFPSSLYELPDAASPTGVRLDVPSGAVPTPDTGEAFDPTHVDARTGWASTVTILWAAPGGVDPASLVPSTDLASSIGGSSSTVLLDMTANTRLAHFAEVDANEGSDFDRQAVYVRPAQRLPGGHRIAVGIRKSVKARGGGALPVSDGFQAVLDDRATGHARLDAARPRLREAVAALETAGVPRDDLLVAWDFTVEDDASAMADQVAARDAMLGALGSGSYTVTSDLGTINNDPRLARRIELDFDVPEIAAPGLDGFHRGADHQVIAQGTMTAHAYIMVPPCATAANKAGILLYGHGFFGNINELRTSEYLRQLAQDGCLVVMGTNWTGMSSDDVPNVLLALSNVSKIFGAGERAFQGIVNFVALEQLARGTLAANLLVDGQGQSVVDPTRVYYLGISQGHILGSVFTAYDPFITRSVLHVGGANWSLMFERSKNWEVYGAPLKGAYDGLLDAAIMEQFLEMGLEPIDGATTAEMPPPGTPAKSYLLNMSVGDTQVPNLATQFQARSLGLSVVTPSVMEPYGLPTTATTDRGLVIIDEHPTPLPPPDNTTFGYDNVAHENPRRRAAIQQLMRDFWATGTIKNTCNGACDCAAGNCGALEMAMYGGS